jgi:hypothetical protein
MTSRPHQLFFCVFLFAGSIEIELFEFYRFQGKLRHQVPHQLFGNPVIPAHLAVYLAVFVPLLFFAVSILDHVCPFYKKVLPGELLIPEGEMLGQHPAFKHFRVPYACLGLIFQDRSRCTGYNASCSAATERINQAGQCDSSQVPTFKNLVFIPSLSRTSPPAAARRPP